MSMSMSNNSALRFVPGIHYITEYARFLSCPICRRRRVVPICGRTKPPAETRNIRETLQGICVSDSPTKIRYTYHITSYTISVQKQFRFRFQNSSWRFPYQSLFLLLWRSTVVCTVGTNAANCILLLLLLVLEYLCLEV